MCVLVAGCGAKLSPGIKETLKKLAQTEGAELVEGINWDALIGRVLESESGDAEIEPDQEGILVIVENEPNSVNGGNADG